MKNTVAACLFFAVALGATSANASAIIPLDTFPPDGTPFTTNLPVSAVFEWQELAIPFHVPAAGSLTQIDTAIFITGGTTPLLVGAAKNPLVGLPFPTNIFAQTVCSTVFNPMDGKNFCEQNAGLTGIEMVSLDPGEFYTWTGHVFLEAGDYWLYASMIGDFVFGGWYTNSDILRDDWAARGCALGIQQGVGCVWSATTWASVADYGPVLGLGGGTTAGGAHAIPIARIQFEPGLRIPEPSSWLLLISGLAITCLFRNRRRSL